MDPRQKLDIASLACAAAKLLRDVRIDRIQAERKVLQEILQVHLILICPDRTGRIDQHSAGLDIILGN